MLQNYLIRIGIKEKDVLISLQSLILKYDFYEVMENNGKKYCT